MRTAQKRGVGAAGAIVVAGRWSGLYNAKAAPPAWGHLAQPQEGPHLHEVPQPHDFGWTPHWQVGAQVQGLHLQVLGMVELLMVRFWEFMEYNANRARD